MHGEVIEVNPLFTKDPVTGQLLDKNLAVLHDDPYGRGWLVKIRLADDARVSTSCSIMPPIEKQCAEEGH